MRQVQFRLMREWETMHNLHGAECTVVPSGAYTTEGLLSAVNISLYVYIYNY